MMTKYEPNYIGVKAAIVVQKDGLDEEGFAKELSEFGEVWDKEDSELDPETPIKIFYIKTSFGGYVKIKIDYNCVEPRKYMLFPMASLSDKMQVNKMLEKT